MPLISNLEFLFSTINMDGDAYGSKHFADNNWWTKTKELPAQLNLQHLEHILETFGCSFDHLTKVDLKQRHKIHNELDLKLLVIDVDGTLSDGGMYYSENGDEFKRFNTQDGMFIKRLTKKGFEVAFLSGGLSPEIASRRGKMLGVQRVMVQWEKPKINVLQQWCDELGITLENVVFIGDDVNDQEVMEKSGLSACPADASFSILETADIILSRKGGMGCVREFIERYLLK